MLTNIGRINDLLNLAEVLKEHGVRVEIGQQVNIWVHPQEGYPDGQTTDVEAAYSTLMRHKVDLESRLTRQRDSINIVLSRLQSHSGR